MHGRAAIAADRQADGHLDGAASFRAGDFENGLVGRRFTASVTMLVSETTVMVILDAGSRLTAGLGAARRFLHAAGWLVMAMFVKKARGSRRRDEGDGGNEQ